MLVYEVVQCDIIDNKFNRKKGLKMAKRDESGKLRGSISNRVQALNPVTKRWVKIDTNTGKIIAHKSSSPPYKNVRKK